MKTDLSAVHVGDAVTVRCHSMCGNREPGDYREVVVVEDEGSIGVEGAGGHWWFYRNGDAYCGDATIVTSNIN